MPITDLATNVILDNVGKVYFLKTGVYRDQVGLDNNHPLSSVSALLIHIEDGVPQNVMVANYAPSKMASWASHDFPLWYRGQVEYTITGESSPRTFAQYFTYVPSILVAMNKNGTSIMDVNVTITQSTGANLLGGFADLTALNSEFSLADPVVAEGLADDLATAYVYESGTKGFYRVAWNSGTSEWVWQLVDQALVTYGVQTKQYNVLPIKVQRGFAPNQTPLTVSDEVIRLIYQEIAYVNAVIANHTELIGDLDDELVAHMADLDNPHEVTALQTAYSNIVSLLTATTVQGAIDEIVGRLDTAEEDIVALEGRMDTAEEDIDDLETFRDVTVPATYETIANADTHRGRTTDLETQVGTHAGDIAVLKSDLSNAKQDIDTKEELLNKATNFSTIDDIKYPSVKAVNDQLSFKVNKTQTIIGIDLQDNITLNEFKTALGNATQSVAGLLSAEDKTHLDGLVALLSSSDGNTVVDTIGEILAIFNNYPEGADLVTVLNGKVDKVAGKGLSQNDFTDIDKNKVNLSYTHSEIVDGSNPHNTKFLNIADKPTTRDGYGITDVYTKPETYTQLEINNLLDNLSAVKGLKSTLLTPTELSNGDTISTNLLTNNGAFVVFTATNTSTGEIDSDTVPVSTIITGKKFVFFDNQETVFTIGETNSTFETSEDVTLKINLLYLDSEKIQAVVVEFDGSLTNYLENQENVQSAVSKLDEELKTTNDNSSNHITDMNNPHGVTASQIGAEPAFTKNTAFNKNFGTTADTVSQGDHNHDLVYETKTDATTHKARTTALENANMVKSIAVVGTNLFTITFYDNTTSNILTLAQLKSFIGEATNALSGLMTAQHVTDLEMLMALFDGDGDAVVNTIAEVLAIFEDYPEGVDLVTALAGKVDKTTTIAGVNLANDITKEELQIALDVDDIIDGTQNITFNNTISGLTATTIKGALDEIDGNVDELETRTTVLESKIDVVGLDYKEYGIREVVGQSASEFERVTRFGGEIKLGSATGLVANVAIDDADATNSFDYIPIFKREVVDIDATDLSANVVSNTFVKVPKFYIKEEWVTEGEIEYHYIFMSQFKHEGYRLPLPFQREDGTERDYTYMGAYEAFLDGNNKLRSLTGQIPKVNYSKNNFRIAARALDGLGVNSKYQITDLEYVDLVQIPFMIEFATKHSQGVFAGATSMAYSASHTAIADGTSVNFIVVSNATGAAFVLGQTVSIGTSHSNDSIAKDRIVTQIDVDTPNVGETTITFDGAAVNITIGHVIASRAWKTGMTDNVKVSGTHALNDGKHSIVWRGLENPFGNILKNVDGVKISNWRAYVAENPKDYNDTASVGGVYAKPYLPLGYLNANANNYAQDLGYDANYPYAKFPISVQASSGLYFRDYYYQNTGDRTVFVGGAWNYSSHAGLFSWDLGGVLGYTYFSLGARLSYRP